LIAPPYFGGASRRLHLIVLGIALLVGIGIGAAIAIARPG